MQRKMVHLVPVKQTITASETAQVYWTNIGRLHGVPRSIVSDRDPRFVSKFWQGLWSLLGTKLRMSSAYHPQTDGQTEAMNRVVEMILRSIMHESRDYATWETILSIVEFVVNNSPAQSTGYIPFFLNFGYHPCTPIGHPQGSRRDDNRDCESVHLEDAAGVFSSPILFA